jgi:hypothetical protein
MRTARTQQAIDIVVNLCLTGGHTLKTRLRETAHGDIHDLPTPLGFPGISPEPKDVISALEELEQEGLVVRSETVHVYDGTEYIIVWALAE